MTGMAEPEPEKGGGGLTHSQILADQFQPGGQIMPPTLILSPPDFQT